MLRIILLVSLSVLYLSNMVNCRKHGGTIIIIGGESGGGGGGHGGEHHHHHQQQSQISEF